MKKLLLSSWLCLTFFFCTAQIEYQPDSLTTNEQDIDQIFQNLNKTNITTGALYDRSAAITSLYKFNETNLLPCSVPPQNISK